MIKKIIFIGKFTRTKMSNCIITDAMLNNCEFVDTDLRNL
jgi:hypothetical protein